MKRQSGPTLLEQFESPAPPTAGAQDPVSHRSGIQHAGRGTEASASISPERKFLRTESSEGKARKWAEAFTYARTLIGLPSLEVERQGDEWAVVNPDVNAVYLLPRGR